MMPVRTDRRERRGAAAAEAALLLPFLGLMFVVAADYCRIFYQTQTVQGCADAAVRYASGNAQYDPSVGATDAAKAAAVAEGASLNPPLTKNAVAVSVQNGQATVTVTYTFQTLTNYPGLPSTVTLTRTARMQVAPKTPGAP
jgi:Flp pilus assembly protein TadG